MEFLKISFLQYKKNTFEKVKYNRDKLAPILFFFSNSAHSVNFFFFFLIWYMVYVYINKLLLFFFNSIKYLYIIIH